jgi:hypothetical protein
MVQRNIVEASFSGVWMLGCTQVTDALMKTLEKVKGLRALQLGYTKVTDQGMRDLPRFKALEEIRLFAEESITDVSLEALGQVTKLTAVSLACCGDAVRRPSLFQKACVIRHLLTEFPVHQGVVLDTNFEKGTL